MAVLPLAYGQIALPDSLCADSAAISAEQAVTRAMEKARGVPEPYAGPQAQLVRLGNVCTWKVEIARYRHTRRGECKRTNGCTLVTTTTLWLDTHTGRLRKRTKHKRLYPNYE